MIVIRMELWPGGVEARKVDLGSAHITNVGGTEDLGDYSVELYKGAMYSKSNVGKIWRVGSVEGFPRASRTLGPWDLLYRALRDVVGSRNRE